MATHPVKLDPADFDVKVSGDTFTNILANTVGDLGSHQDGFYLDFYEAVHSFGNMQVQIDGGDHDLDAATKTLPAFAEPFIDDAQKAVLLAYVQGQVDLSTFDGTFVNVPQPPTPPGQGASGSGCADPMPTVDPPAGEKWCCINGTWTSVPVGTDCNAAGAGDLSSTTKGGGGGGSGGSDTGPCHGSPLVEIAPGLWVCID